jgi:hypothetical protein
MVAVMLVAAACASTGPRSGRPRSDSRTITQAELATATQTNLYDYIAVARPRWLQSRAPANLGGRSLAVAVFLNGQNIGGPPQLRSFSLDGVSSIRFYDASEAQARFNVRDVGAVIQVITQ